MFRQKAPTVESAVRFGPVTVDLFHLRAAMVNRDDIPVGAVHYPLALSVTPEPERISWPMACHTRNLEGAPTSQQSPGGWPASKAVEAVVHQRDA